MKYFIVFFLSYSILHAEENQYLAEMQRYLHQYNFESVHKLDVTGKLYELEIKINKDDALSKEQKQYLIECASLTKEFLNRISSEEPKQIVSTPQRKEVITEQKEEVKEGVKEGLKLSDIKIVEINTDKKTNTSGDSKDVFIKRETKIYRVRITVKNNSKLNVGKITFNVIVLNGNSQKENIVFSYNEDSNSFITPSMTKECSRTLNENSNVKSVVKVEIIDAKEFEKK